MFALQNKWLLVTLALLNFDMVFVQQTLDQPNSTNATSDDDGMIDLFAFY